MEKPDKETGPLVSVCLMTYNRPHYIRGAIECWLAQTYKDFELIISDDASTDGETERICREFAAKDPRIRYIRQEKNLGFLLCYKFILSQARGTYFIWASDDDLWDKRFLEDCMKMYGEHPEYALVFADMVDIDKDGKEFKHLDPAKYVPSAADLYERLKQHMLFYFDDGKLQLIFGLWKREAVLRDPLFGYEPDKREYYWGFDNFLVFRSLSNGSVGFVSEKRFFRRSRVLDEYRPPRPFVPRLLFSFYHRLKKVFASPYFWYVARHVMSIRELTPWQRAKLVGWDIFVAFRVFFVKKV